MVICRIFRLPIGWMEKNIWNGLNLFKVQTQPSSCNGTKDKRPKIWCSGWRRVDDQVMAMGFNESWDQWYLNVFDHYQSNLGLHLKNFTQKLEMRPELMKSRLELVQSNRETKLWPSPAIPTYDRNLLKILVQSGYWNKMCWRRCNFKNFH